MTTITNLTPHAVTIRLADGTDRTFPASGVVARVSTKQEACAHPTGLPAATRSLGAVEGLPDGDDYLIVSTMVFDALLGSDRSRLLVPDSGPDAIRENGQIVAVRRFIVG